MATRESNASLLASAGGAASPGADRGPDRKTAALALTQEPQPESRKGPQPRAASNDPTAVGLLPLAGPPDQVRRARLSGSVGCGGTATSSLTGCTATTECTRLKNSRPIMDVGSFSCPAWNRCTHGGVRAQETAHTAARAHTRSPWGGRMEIPKGGSKFPGAPGVLKGALPLHNPYFQSRGAAM